MSVNAMYNMADGIVKGHFDIDLIYCVQDGNFYVYKDGYWDVISITDLLGTICDHPKAREHHIETFSISTIKQIPECLKLRVRRSMSEFNVNGWLNFPSGLYDVSGGNFMAHSKDIISTIRLPYKYDATAMCGLWAKTLLEIFEGSIAKMETLQEFFGYCLTRETIQNKALLLIGESNSGKSTILDVLRNMVGIKNCSNVPMKFISNPQHTPALINKLVNIDSDVSDKAQDFEYEFKIITRGEPVTCNQKFIAAFEFTPYCKIVMAANTFPRITDHSSAFYNRLIIIPCNRVFEESEQNKALPKLLMEELPGIFQWALAGYKRLKKRGMFDKKDFIKEALEDLRDESNPVDVFFRETVQTDTVNKTSVIKHELYNKYCEWCRNNGNAPMSTIKFGKAVYQKYGSITEKKSQNGDGVYIWRNLRYKTHDKPQDNVMWQD